MNETSTAAAAATSGGILVKVIGVPILAAIFSTALGFSIMWPKSPKEAFLRFLSAIASSIIFGPLLVIWVNSWRPAWFQSAREVAVMFGQYPMAGYVAIAGVLMALAALPAWLIGGAIARWFDKRKHKDIGELAIDVAATVSDVRKSM